MATYRGMFPKDVITDEIQTKLVRGASIEELIFVVQEPDPDVFLTNGLSKYVLLLR
ncbi:hypothetical protein HFO02_34075 [Rhizobium laguerreae]|uniref:hypothetical protein n=1 Tax=Rhizobium laguerreae TaxID=1076926 RepID=UPI001C909D1D|nr:hypothetical protein [Rhizobium laguerreae]MBY3328529.1 hypothetical protein [Rhizobium laguerreae]